MFNKLKQFKDLRSKAKHLQDLLANESAEGSAGWGKVKVTVDGNQRVSAVMIDPEATGDCAKLQELVKEAVNDAMQKIQKIVAAKLRETGGLDLARDFGDAMKS